MYKRTWIFFLLCLVLKSHHSFKNLVYFLHICTIRVIKSSRMQRSLKCFLQCCLKVKDLFCLLIFSYIFLSSLQKVKTQKPWAWEAEEWRQKKHTIKIFSAPINHVILCIGLTCKMKQRMKYSMGVSTLAGPPMWNGFLWISLMIMGYFKEMLKYLRLIFLSSKVLDGNPHPTGAEVTKPCSRNCLGNCELFKDAGCHYFVRANSKSFQIPFFQTIWCDRIKAFPEAAEQL